MPAWNLADELTELDEIKLIAAGHLRAGNRAFTSAFETLIRATEAKIGAIEAIERLQKRPQRKGASGS